jgi:dTDP-4-amino-4,6-dideoxygalactose transaminase
LSSMGRHFGYRRGRLPVTEDRYGRLLRLPLYNQMSVRECQAVVRALKKAL